MKRKELFEFEDFPRLPKTIRAGITNLIVVFHKIMGTPVIIADLILDLKKSHKFSRIIDLGSGSGGAMPEVIKIVNAKNPQQPTKLLLSDLHPSKDIVNETNKRSLDNISYYEQPVNAIDLGNAPKGLKTMIASFHHMNPKTAERILRSSEENNEPILIYEVAKNNIPFIVWLLLLPISLLFLMLMSWFMTPFVRPFTFSQFLFTYIIPIIPIVYAWDGQASLMRTYTFEDVKKLLKNNEIKTYEWKIGDAKKANGKNLGYYIIGTPKINRS